MWDDFKSLFQTEGYKKVVLPTALLSATIIGAGIFSLPYVVSEAGWVVGIIYLILAPMVFYFVHAMYADILLRSDQGFKFVGYAKYYLGEFAYWTSIVVTVIGAILTLTAYIVLAKSFLTIILPVWPLAKYNIAWFWALGSAALFLRVRRMARVEFFITALMVFLIFLVFVFGVVGNPGKGATLPTHQWWLWFLPFGPFLFSFSGRTAIPSLIDYYKENNLTIKDLKRAIALGTFLPTIVYLVFIIGVIGLSNVITSDSINSIISLPYSLAVFVAGIGLLSLLSSYIVIGISIKEILIYDMKIGIITSDVLTIAAPLILFFMGFNNFFKVISLVGGIFLALESILVIALWRRVDKLHKENLLFKFDLPNTLAPALLVIFFLGILYSAAY